MPLLSTVSKNTPIDLTTHKVHYAGGKIQNAARKLSFLSDYDGKEPVTTTPVVNKPIPPTDTIELPILAPIQLPSITIPTVQPLPTDVQNQVSALEQQVSTLQARYMAMKKAAQRKEIEGSITNIKASEQTASSLISRIDAALTELQPLLNVDVAEIKSEAQNIQSMLVKAKQAITGYSTQLLQTRTRLTAELQKL